MNRKIELLAPAGDFNKLKTALHFGADAVYVGGNEFSLRAGAKNFDEKGMVDACKYAHNLGKKVYATVNIFAKNSDFEKMEGFFKSLEEAKVDGVIISDAGVIEFCKKYAPSLEIHLSTQANTTNKYSAKFWADNGVSRIVLARETTLREIAEIRDFLPDNVMLESFVHGAMCVAYSGRCLLSNVLTGRNSNRGECVQACRWEYGLSEVNRGGAPLIIGEEERGTYILNSKDLNMLAHIDKLFEAGVDSFKIEGRMKSQYYVGSVTNAYRKAIDSMRDKYEADSILIRELEKTSHRDYSTGFYFEEKGDICLETSQPKCDYEFMAEVKGYDEEKGRIIIEQRNRFRVGDELEILSVNGKYFNTKLRIEKMYDNDGNEVFDAKNVQQILHIPSDKKLSAMDILRKEV